MQKTCVTVTQQSESLNLASTSDSEYAYTFPNTAPVLKGARVEVGNYAKKDAKKGARKAAQYRKQMSKTLEGAALDAAVKTHVLRLEEAKLGTKARAHTLSPREAAQLNTLLRIGFLTAMAIGAGFAFGALFFEKCVIDLFFWREGGGGTATVEVANATHTWREQARTTLLGQCESPTHNTMSWVGYGNYAFAFVCSMFEVFAIYKVAFRSALRIVAVTGLQLFPVDAQVGGAGGVPGLLGLPRLDDDGASPLVLCGRRHYRRQDGGAQGRGTTGGHRSATQVLLCPRPLPPTCAHRTHRRLARGRPSRQCRCPNHQREVSRRCRGCVHV